MKHLIRKQLIEFITSNKDDAFRLQQLVSDRYWNSVIHILQKIFDRLSDEGTTLHIEKLEIDLGVISETDIEKDRWEDLIYKKLTEMLERSTREPWPQVIFTKQSRKYSIVQQWMYYMRWGHLPWNAAPLNAEWYREVIECFASDYDAITELRHLVLKSVQARERIILQHEKKFLISLLESLSAHEQRQVPAIILELSEVLEWVQNNIQKERKEDKKRIELKLWCRVLEYAAVNKPILQQETIIPDLLEYFEVAAGDIIAFPKKFLAKKRITGMFLPAGKGKDDTELMEGKREYSRKNDEILKQEPKPDKEKTSDGTELTKAPGYNETSINLTEGVDTGRITEWKEDESIFVSYAGLVLLHPFLVRFFRNLGLVKETGFINLESHQKALFLLHYLATGETAVQEHELITAKLLCGYPLHQPVDKNIILAEEETTEANELLLNVIGQWDILKNSSADGLRQGFLQRNGMYVRRGEKSWLQVEAHAIDILLDHLPWNINMVKLPWMNDILWIEWR